MNGKNAGPLHGLRVLELADEKGQFCGKLLADLGADVIKIEPPGGEACRAIGPFLEDVAHPNRSLSFWHYNTSKRGITLNLASAAGAALFRRLAQAADLVVESFPPGHLASLSLGYEHLRADNPGLVLCSITPFGQTGPWKDYLSADLLHMAAGGEMASCGYDGQDIPIAPGGGNAWHMGGHYAMIGIMAALLHRSVSGQGQHVDVSIHEASALTTESAIANYVYRGETLLRQTGRHHAPAPTPRTQFLARDGQHVTALISGGLNPRNVAALAALMEPYGMAADLHDPKYQDPAVVAAQAGHIIDGVLANFIASLPAEEVYHAAQARGFTWAAVRAPEQLLEDAHLSDRDFWKQVEHSELGRAFTYPGEYALFSDSPWHISRRAPLVGEHNVSVLCDELGVTSAELAAFREAGVI